MVDNNELEKRAMALFRAGRSAEAHRLQAEFLAEIAQSGEDLCNCPAACAYHGRCQDCVMIHRGHADHLPFCMHSMVDARIEALSELTEHTHRARDAR